MIRLGVRLAIVTTVLMWWAAPARAQDPIERLLGRPVVGVELRVEGRPETAPALLALIDIHPGDPLSPQAWRRVSQRFEQVPRFEGISVQVEERPGGVLLIFDLRPKHPVDAFDFSGTTGVPKSELERRVREQFSGMPQLARIGEVEDTVKRVLRDEGYLSATASALVVPYHDPDRATMVVTVAAGVRTVIGHVEIRGQSSLDSAGVIARLGLTPGSPFRERALAAGLAQIRDELRARKFYTAIAQHQPPSFSADGATASLVITVDAGPVVELQVNGELPGGVDDFIPIKRQNSVDPDLLYDARVRIVQELKRQGYWHASASYASTQSSPDKLVITFTINRGKRYRIVKLDLPEGLQVGAAEFDAQKALKPGAWFDQTGVERALLVIKGIYQSRGYHLAVMTPGYEGVDGSTPQEGGIVVHPNITEGPRAVVTGITFDLDPQAVIGEAELRSRMQTREQQPYVLANLTADRQDLPAYYESRGFFAQSTSITPTANAAGDEVTLAVVVREGPQIHVGEIIVVGNERVLARTILDTITLRVGAPFSEAARLESQRALYDTSSFRTVRIAADERLPGETTVRVVVSVEEADTKSYDVGGGLEGGTHPRAAVGGGVVDRVEFAPRGFVGFTRRNLGGRNRALSGFARISLRPNNAPGDPTRDGKGLGTPDYRVTGQYQEHYAFNSASDLLLNVTAEQALRTNYNFIRRVGTAQFLRPVTPTVSVLGRYTLEWTKLFDEVIQPQDQPLIDRLFPQVRISMLSGGIVWDRRDDPLYTTTGGQVSANLDVALEKLGSEVGFVKAFTQASYFHPLAARRLVFASRVQLGVARGFEHDVPLEDANGQPILGPGGDQLTAVVEDLPASQRFFAGGSTSQRGFQLDRLGVPDITGVKGVLTPDGLSNGGNGLIVLNAEVRANVGKLFKRDLSVVGFADVGNVFRRVSDIDLARLRPGVGFGVRWDSPLGPLRLDFGFKTDRLLVFTGGAERRWEFHLSIGEVF